MFPNWLKGFLQARLVRVEPKGIEPSTSWMQTSKAPVVSDGSKGLTPTLSDACTAACTNKPENGNADALNTTSLGTSLQVLDTDQGKGDGIDQGDPLVKLADVLLALSPADWARLAAMLTRHP